MKRTITVIFSALAGTVLGAVIIGRISGNKINRFAGLADKHLALFLMMNQWIKAEQNGKELSKYLLQNGYKDIAVYGVSYVGETLVNELKNTEINVIYGIDQNAENIYADINLVSPDDELENVDAIIITPIKFFDEIEKKLSKKVNCPILSLEDILYEV